MKTTTHRVEWDMTQTDDSGETRAYVTLPNRGVRAIVWARDNKDALQRAIDVCVRFGIYVPIRGRSYHAINRTG